MHQARRSFHVGQFKRFIGPTCVALVPLLALMAIHLAIACYPGCVIWNENNPEWYVFLCFLCG